MKNWKSSILILILLVLMSSVPAAYGQSPQQPKSSASGSPNSDIRANEEFGVTPLGVNAPRDLTRKRVTLTDACAAAAEDLKATRVLAEALESENRALKTRLETEKQTTALLLELNETRKSETDALQAAVTAKNETIAAKDTVIASQEKLIEALKTKKTSPWKRLGDILIGAAMIAIVK